MLIVFMANAVAFGRSNDRCPVWVFIESKFLSTEGDLVQHLIMRSTAYIIYKGMAHPILSFSDPKLLVTNRTGAFLSEPKPKTN